MEKKKTNKVVVFLVFILTTAACAGFIWFKLQEVEKNKTNDDKKKSSETKKEDTKKEEVVDETKYTNYTEYLVSEDVENGKFILKINNGIFEAYLGDKKINVTGIEGKAKSFNYGHDCGGNFTILVLTEDNKLFLASYDQNDLTINNLNNIIFKFEQIKTTLDIDDITIHFENGWTTCGEPYQAVVLKNKEIRALYYNGNDYNIGTFDYSVIKQVFYSSKYRLILYTDNTISDYYWLAGDVYYKYNAELNKKFKYNNANLIVDKVIEDSTNEAECIYIVSDNKLYKITMDLNGPITKSINITLVNNTDIKSESLSVNKGLNSYDIEKEDVITFTDGKQVTISNISSVYSTK